MKQQIPRDVPRRSSTSPGAASRSSAEEEKPKQSGQTYVVTIGIDRYQRYGRLHNAVNDARGALEVFTGLGFKHKASLFDEEATGQAMRRLVADELRGLDSEDSLIVFFAGHGHTETIPFTDGYSKVGYILPVDGDKKERSTWLRLKNWLNEIAHLPAKHILVILDSCNSGIALEPEYRWRSGGEPDVPFALKQLVGRRSRRIITSALDDQFASDVGPRPRHSLFTGMLIEALSGGMQGQHGYITGSALGLHIQEAVISHSKSRQTPDFGAMELDNRGEMLFPLRSLAGKASSASSAPPQPASTMAAGTKRVAPALGGARRPTKPRLPVWIKGASTTTTTHPITSAEPRTRSVAARAGLHGAPGMLDSKFASALDKQAKPQGGAPPGLSVLVGQPRSALHAFATWSAQRGSLTLVSSESTLEEATKGVLAHMPWMRLLPAARVRIAAAANLKVAEVEASLDGRGGDELKAWFASIAGGDSVVLVAGWLLAAARNLNGMAAALAAPPLRGAELLEALGQMGAPISLVLHHDEPSQAWLGGALSVASRLRGWMSWQPVAVTASEESSKLISSSKAAPAIARAKGGIIRAEGLTLPSGSREYEGAIESVLWEALSKDPRTRRHFEYRVRAPVHEREREVEVLLASRSARLIIELDSWHRDSDPQAYLRERIKDTRLQRAGFSVMRFLPEDVEQRSAAIVEEIALGLSGRRESLLTF